ncbi:dirigent protein 19-like [Populus nigra]|uniref:dirigent protein 19-like n=1 Tax=Populus nigra TaxID=3691 RepID=UPI002B264CB7|nr:dirigent protein 19-like [Populus nigra]
MATYIPFILFFVVFSTFFSAINSKFSEQSPLTITMKAVEKKTSLHFYFHDISSGKNQTSTAIARPLNMTAAANFFGSTSRADVLLREGPEPTSKLVGREQGIYAFASQHNAVLLMVMNSAFVDGIYNGSSLSTLGRNAIFDSVREMPVVGGSGVSRLARGYALAKTFSFNLKAGVAVIEYNVSVVYF